MEKLSLLFVDVNRGTVKMKNTFSDGYKFILSAIVLALLFFMAREIDFVFLKAFYNPDEIGASKYHIQDFSLIRDFITIITGLLTLIVGAAGFGSYISFKKFREEERNITNKRKELSMFLAIEEARNTSESELSPSLSIDLYNKAKAIYDDSYLLYTLRGDAYYLKGDPGDIEIAIDNYEKAISKNELSSRAWFGLGQAIFKRAELRGTQCERRKEVDIFSDYAINDIDIFIDYTKTTDSDVARNAILHIQKAISYGYPEAPANLEIGKIYRSIGNKTMALSSFKKAYAANRNYSSCGFYYAALWVKEHHTDIKKCDETKEIINVLKHVSMLDLYNSKAAQAILWYIYEKTGNPISKQYMPLIDPATAHVIFTQR